MMTDTANDDHALEFPDIPKAPCHMWHIGRFFAADQGGEPPPGHRWVSWERYKGDLLIYIGSRWWIEVAGRAGLWSARRR